MEEMNSIRVLTHTLHVLFNSTHFLNPDIHKYYHFLRQTNHRFIVFRFSDLNSEVIPMLHNGQADMLQVSHKASLEAYSIS